MDPNNNIFEKAQEFYQKNPQDQVKSKKRSLAVKELLLVIETAPFLSEEQKTQMSYLIPIYPLPVIEQVKHSLIQQGQIFLQLNPTKKEPVEDWLHTVAQQ